MTASTAPTPLVTALFMNPRAAERAYRAVIDLGYTDDEVNVLLAEETRTKHFAHSRAQSGDLASKARDSSKTDVADELGGPTGGTVATIAPAIAALGTALLVPGLGLLAAGPVAIALTAAGAVGVAGGLVGALTDWGVPKTRLRRYEDGIREGGVVLAVHAHSQEHAEDLKRRWDALGAENIRD